MSKHHLLYFGINETLSTENFSRHIILEFDYDNFVIARYHDSVKQSFNSFAELSQLQTNGEQIHIRIQNTRYFPQILHSITIKHSKYPKIRHSHRLWQSRNRTSKPGGL
jgi:hypothetical protein